MEKFTQLLGDCFTSFMSMDGLAAIAIHAIAALEHPCSSYESNAGAISCRNDL